MRKRSWSLLLYQTSTRELLLISLNPLDFIPEDVARFMIVGPVTQCLGWPLRARVVGGIAGFTLVGKLPKHFLKLTLSYNSGKRFEMRV